MRELGHLEGIGYACKIRAFGDREAELECTHNLKDWLC
jgi:hypothetical protein